MTIFRKIYASMTLCKDDFEQKRLKRLHAWKTLQKWPYFYIVIFVKITLQKMTAQRLLCAKMTLYKDDHVQTQLCTKLPLCKNNSLHKWLCTCSSLQRRLFKKMTVQRWMYAKITLCKDDPAKSPLCKDDSLPWLLSLKMTLYKDDSVQTLQFGEATLYIFKGYPLWSGLWVENILSRVKSVLRGPYRNRTLWR